MPEVTRKTLVASPLTPGFRWNPTAGRAHEGRYIDAAGRIVSQARVRGALDQTIMRSELNVADLTTGLREGRISLAEWQRQMAAELKSAHLAAAASARGGWAQMTQADYGRVGQRLRFQYQKLNEFAADIASGKQRLDGTLTRRARMYVAASRGTRSATEQAARREQGFDQERNVLGQAEHCTGDGSCVQQTERGWVSIGQLIPIGARLCLTSCKCFIAYRNSETGMVTG